MSSERYFTTNKRHYKEWRWSKDKNVAENRVMIKKKDNISCLLNRLAELLSKNF